MDTYEESCSTRITLLTAWQKAAEAYSKAVAELTRRIGTASKREYEWLSRVAQDARNRSVEAQANLQAHMNEHGCHDGDGGEAAA
jgi:hypothetical protein